MHTIKAQLRAAAHPEQALAFDSLVSGSRRWRSQQRGKLERLRKVSAPRQVLFMPNLKRIVFWLGLLSALLGNPVALLAQVPQGEPPDALPVLEPERWPAGRVERAQLPGERSLEFEFQGVESSEIQGWLRWIGFEMPVELSGSLSGWLWAQRSSQGWFRFSDYRVEGEITAPSLGIADWQIHQGRLRFGYRDQVWYVGSLSGDVQTRKTPTMASVDLHARLPLAEEARDAANGSQRITLGGSASQLEVRHLLQAFGADLAVQNERGEVQLRGQLPLNGLSNPSSWRMQAAMILDGLRFAGLPEIAVDIQTQLAQGAWQVQPGTVTQGENRLQVQASGRIDGNLPFAAELNSSKVDWASLLATSFEESGWDARALRALLPPALRLEARVEGDRQGLSNSLAQLDLLPEVSNVEVEPTGKVILRVAAGQDTEALVSIELQALPLGGGAVDARANWNDWERLNQGIPDRAEMQVRDVDLAQLVVDEFLPSWAAKYFDRRTGVVKGKVNFQTLATPAGALQWGGHADLEATDLRGLGAHVESLQLKVAKQLPEEQAVVELAVNGRQLTAEGQLSLASPPGRILQHSQWSRFRGSGLLDGWTTELAIEALTHEVPIEANGTFALEADFSQSEWRQRLATATLQLDSLQSRIGARQVTLRDARVSVTPDVWQLSRFTIEDTVGRVAGSARWPRDGRSLALVNLRIVDVELEPMLAAVSIDALASLRGRVAGELRLQKEEVSQPLMEGWKGRFYAALRDAQYRQLDIGTVALQGKLENRTLELKGTGNILAGDFAVTGDWPVPTSGAPKAGPKPQLAEEELRQAEVAWNGIDLRQAAALALPSANRMQIAGSASLNARAQFDPSGQLSGSALVRVPFAACYGQRIAEDFALEVSYANQRLAVEQLEGKIAGGRLRATGSVLVRPESPDFLRNGSLLVSASGLRLASLLALARPELADDFTGTIDYRGRLQLDRTILASGQGKLRNACLYGISVEYASGNLRATLGKDGRLVKLACHNVRGTALQGGLQGSVKIRGGADWGLEATGEILHGRLDQLASEAGFEHVVGQGVFSGKVSVQTPKLSKLGALTGSVWLDFERGEARSVPILAEIGKYLPVSSLASTSIRYGSLQGRIGGGRLRIQELFINGSSLWLAATGAIGLADQRLDLELLVQTGGSIEQQATRACVQRVLLLAAPEVAVVTQFTDVVRNRALYFNVRGTASKPVIQPKLTETLARALVQNIRRSLLAPTPVANN